MPVIHDDSNGELAPVVGLLGVGNGGLGSDLSLSGSDLQPYVLTQRGVGAAITSEPLPSLYIKSRSGQNQTAELQDAIDTGGLVSRRVELGPGSFLVDPDSIKIRYQHVGIEGQGNSLSNFVMNDAGVCVEFNNDTGGMARNFIRNCGFTSIDTTSAKVAIRVVGGTQFEASNFTVGVSNTWRGGDGSIGLQLRGHELGVVDTFAIYTDLPISIEDHPYNTFDLDGWAFDNAYLLVNAASTNPVIRVASGVNFTGNSFRNHRWYGGHGGFVFIDTTSAQFGQFCQFDHIIWENSTTSDWMIDFQHNTGFRHLTLTRLYNGSSTQNGYRLRKVHHAAIRSCEYTGTLSALDVDGAGMDLLTIDQFRNGAGSTRSMTGMTLVSGAGDPASASEPNRNQETWVSSTNANLDTAVVLRRPDFTTSTFSMNGALFQSFVIEIVNTAGTIQHRIGGDILNGVAALPALVSKITGASFTLANTPSVDAVTNFTSGVGIDAAEPSRIIFNTAAQTLVASQAIMMARVEQNSTATAGVNVVPRFRSSNVNGTTRSRFVLDVKTAADATHALTTANIGASAFIRIRVWAFIE